LEFLIRHRNRSLGGVIAKAIYSTEKSKQQTEIYRIWHHNYWEINWT